MILLTAFFPTPVERAAELELCLRHNLDQPTFSRVVLLCEKAARPSFEHPKLECLDIAARPTYGEFFACANSSFAGQICVISNTDVMYDQTLAKFEALPESRWFNRLYAITRTNEDGNFQNPGSQDTWVFKAPLRDFNWNIVLGIIGCDSYLAQRALEAGLWVQNPALSIRCLHRHRVPVRNDWLPDQWCYWKAQDYRAVSVPYSTLE